MSFSTDSLITRMQDRIDGLREILDRFEAAQDENSDESNEDKIDAARSAIEDAETAIMDLVP